MRGKVMLKIIYTEKGSSYNDFNLLEKAHEIIIDYYQINKKDTTVHVSTSNIIEALRVLIKRGKISNDDIVFEFEGELIKSNARGKMSHYPKGFIDWYDYFLDEILDI